MKVVALPIKMVCWADKEGVTTPVRFKVTTEDNEEKVIKIHRIISRDMERLAGNRMHIYDCIS